MFIYPCGAVGGQTSNVITPFKPFISLPYFKDKPIAETAYLRQQPESVWKA
jgi:hypothetical protein